MHNARAGATSGRHGAKTMNALDRERFYKHQRREAARLDADTADRLVNPWLYQSEDIPAVWNHSDLDTDARRER